MQALQFKTHSNTFFFFNAFKYLQFSKFWMHLSACMQADDHPSAI